jgi:hypothetical protein
VEERLARNLQLGTKTIVRIENGQDFAGEVASITASAENRTKKVEVKFTAGKNFLVGQSATIYFPFQ